MRCAESFWKNLCLTACISRLPKSHAYCPSPYRVSLAQFPRADVLSPRLQSSFCPKQNLSHSSHVHFEADTLLTTPSPSLTGNTKTEKRGTELQTCPALLKVRVDLFWGQLLPLVPDWESGVLVWWEPPKGNQNPPSRAGHATIHWECSQSKPAKQILCLPFREKGMGWARAYGAFPEWTCTKGPLTGLQMGST